MHNDVSSAEAKPAKRPGRRTPVRAIARALAITLAVGVVALANVRDSSGSPAITVAATPVLGMPASDGMQHLEYDLIVASRVPAPFRLRSVEVLDVDHRSLLRLDGDKLVAATQPLDGLTPSSTIPASGSVAVVVDLLVAQDKIPARLIHRIAYNRTGAPTTHPSTRSINLPELAVDLRSALLISPPLRGPGWLSANSCCDAATTHRSGRVIGNKGVPPAKPETFAIDWIQLHGDQPFTGDGARPQQWYGYGSDIHAAIGGTVIEVRDGLPDSAPNALPAGIDRADTAGNHVIVQIRPDTWALYAHLQPGSLAVAVGDKVATGQILGKLGNSGNSLAPHLHFGLLDSPHPDAANSLPFVLDHYIVAETVDRDSYLAAFSGTGPLKLRPHSHPSPQSSTFPLILAVTDFS